MSNPITPESAVYDIKSLSNAVVSPDGTRIVYVVAQTERESGKTRGDLWLCNIDGSNARQLTYAGRSNGDPQWSPDGSRIAFVSGRDGDHPGAIAVLQLNGGESKVVTSHLASPLSLAWSPDGKSIAYHVETDPENEDETPRDPKAAAPVIVVDRLDYKVDGRGVYNHKRAQIWVVDVETGDRRRLTGHEVRHSQPRWSPDGKTIACLQATANDSDYSIALVDLISGKVTRQEAVTGSTSNLWWIPDGSGLLYLGDPDQTSHADYCVLNSDSGEIRTVAADLPFLPDIGYQNTSPVGKPIWLSDTEVIVHGLRNGASGLWLLDISSGSLDQVGYWEAMHGGLSATPDGATIVQSRKTLEGAGQLVAIDRKSGTVNVLLDVNAEYFSESPMAAWERISLNRAGFEVEGWLLKPPGFDEQKKYPLVLSVHGGPHNAYGHTFDIQGQVLAAHGYLVLMMNPRGSGTYSRAFAQAVVGDWGGEDWNDLQAAVDLVCERSYVDADRTGIYGYSYGGYMTAWAIGHTDRFKAAVCGAPVYDMISFFGTCDLGFYFTPAELLADPWKDRDKLISMSPNTYAANFRTPTLIIQGEADDRCPVGQAEQLFVDLKLQGVDAVMARYPGGSHLMLSNAPAAHRIDYLQRVVDWFDSYLQPERV